MSFPLENYDTSELIRRNAFPVSQNTKSVSVIKTNVLRLRQ